MRPLVQCLLDAGPLRLQAIASFWDVELTTNRPRDIAAQLAVVLSAPEAIGKAWDKLPQEQRQALADLLAHEGRMPARIFTRRWGEIRPMGPARMERERPWLNPTSPAEGLWYAGFISRVFSQESEGAYEFIFIPPELKAHLPAVTSPAELTIRLEPALPPVVAYMHGEALLDDACTLLAYLQNGQVRPTAEGDWPAQHRASLATQLRDATPERQDFLHHLVRRVGWLRTVMAGKDHATPILRPDPDPVTAWLHTPTEEQRRVLIEAWRDDLEWNDLFHVPTLRPEQTGTWRNDPRLARRAVLRHLKACLPNTWYAIEDFVAAVKQADADFQRPDGDYESWYIRDLTSDTYLSGFDSWERVEGALLRYLLTGPLTWLGLVDVGANPLPGFHPLLFVPQCFRLTQAGASFLGLVAPSPAPETPPLVLHPDFTVWAAPGRRYERFQLSRIADWVSSPPVSPMGRDYPEMEARGRSTAYVYRLTPSSLERAKRQGIPVSRVKEFLAQATGSGEQVTRLLEPALRRWEQKGSEVRLKRALCLLISDDEVMNRVLSSPRMRRYISEQLSTRTALVREQECRELLIALGELGILTDVHLS
ncbi:MAG: helicase-associated domain-containing protein [Anaerolineae bacterium]|nr:helicase-associated domain-containing protein [Anaerolineae bacterium]